MEALGEDGRLFAFAGWLRNYNPCLSGDTIDGYISTLRQRLLVIAPWIPWKRTPVLDGYVKRMRQQPRQRRYKEPINRSVIRGIAEDTTLDPAIRVAVVLAFYGLWRVGDFTYQYRHKVKPTELRRSDVTINSNSMSIHIKRSKSDHYNAGDDHHFNATNNKHCPVKLMRQFLAIQPHLPQDAPLFIMLDGRNLHRRDIDAAIKKHVHIIGIDPSFVATHSIRIGGAFEMKDRGVDWHTIVARARWKPITAEKMLLLYTRMSQSRLSDVFKALDIDDINAALPVIPPRRRARSARAA